MCVTVYPARSSYDKEGIGERETESARKKERGRKTAVDGASVWGNEEEDGHGDRKEKAGVGGRER